MSDPASLQEQPARPASRLARVVLSVFLLTFIFTRVLVILIMSRRIPDLYVHAGGTHVHHLNFGILLLSGIGAYLLFIRPGGRPLTLAAAVYAVGLALTFDEFGMWLHLGGSYWQRASFDAIIIIAALLGLVAVAPRVARFRPRHWATAAALGLSSLLFAAVLFDTFNRLEPRLNPTFQRLETGQPK